VLLVLRIMRDIYTMCAVLRVLNVETLFLSTTIV
jgi:hypothetical protein